MVDNPKASPVGTRLLRTSIFNSSGKVRQSERKERGCVTVGLGRIAAGASVVDELCDMFGLLVDDKLWCG
jgi:hypothetical protein